MFEFYSFSPEHIPSGKMAIRPANMKSYLLLIREEILDNRGARLYSLRKERFRCFDMATLIQIVFENHQQGKGTYEPFTRLISVFKPFVLLPQDDTTEFILMTVKWGTLWNTKSSK